MQLYGLSPKQCQGVRRVNCLLNNTLKLKMYSENYQKKKKMMPTDKTTCQPHYIQQ